MLSRRKNYPALKFLIVFCWCVPIVFMMGCSSVQSPSSAALSDETIGIRTIAVVPFQNVIPEDPLVTYVRCPVSGTYFSSSAAYSGAPEQIIEKALVKKLAILSDITIVASDQVTGAYMRTCADSFKEGPIEVARKVGEQAGVDGVLTGYVYRYRERRGYQYAVEEPASVAFGVYLIRVKNGDMVWKGVFDKTQTSLMENILDVKTFIRGHGTWLTAEQLAEAGIDRILQTFPGGMK